MRLQSFQVMNFRSVNDSGEIEVAERTALVGRNESGKTNLLLALQSLNPAGRKLEILSDVRDFPNDRSLAVFSEDIPVVSTIWVLNESERTQISSVFPRAKAVKQVRVNRTYKAIRTIEFVDIPPLEGDSPTVRDAITKIRQSVKRSSVSHPKSAEQINASLEAFLNAVQSQASPTTWAVAAIKAADTLKTGLIAAQIEMSDTLNQHLQTVTDHSKALQNDHSCVEEAKKLIEKFLPIFLYLDEYPEIDGHQHIPQYLDNSRQRTPQEKEAEKNFAKLMKVAGLNAGQLHRLLSEDHEKRAQLTNRAGSVVTKEIRRLWKDRRLKISFHADGDHFDTMISDPTASYEVDINLNQRSRGFKWFFSFYITFAADTAGGEAQNAILLLDEPGLFLHAKGQLDLLEHFAQDFPNQIVYTTHSPFMVPIDNIASVRTVNTDEAAGTTVSNNPIGDERTLFPLRSALGYELAQSLFIGEQNLVVEGVSDYWYLSSVSEFLRESAGAGLPQGLVITPGGGAQKIPYLVSLLASQKLRVLVLLDEESEARQTALENLVKQKLLHQDYVIFVSEAWLADSVQEADIEDLVDPDVYDLLVRECYSKELQGKTLTLNPHIPRLVKRYELAFEALGIPFHKTRPAKLFLRRIGSDPGSVMTAVTQQRFSSLFSIISERLNRQLQVDYVPFQ